jgi:hypothetical protein
MATDLFAGVRVSDFAKAREWYVRLLGSEPSSPHATEAVWELGEHRSLYILQDQVSPGGALITVFLDDLDGFVEAAGERGLQPSQQVTYTNGVRKAIYRDADGNEIGFGGEPA